MIDLAELTTAASVTVTTPPDALYAMLADVTRMGEPRVHCVHVGRRS